MAADRRRFEEALSRGAAHAWNGQWELAIAEYGRALVDCPEDVTARTQMAMALFKGGRLRDASQAYEDLWKLQPSNLPLLQRMAEIHESLGETESAFASYQLLGELHRKRGAPREALAAWQKAVALIPRRLDLWDSLLGLAAEVGRASDVLKSYLELARGLALSGEFEESIQVMERAQSLDPGNPAVVALLSAIRRGLEHSWRVAAEGREVSLEELAALIPPVVMAEPPENEAGPASAIAPPGPARLRSWIPWPELTSVFDAESPSAPEPSVEPAQWSEATAEPEELSPEWTGPADLTPGTGDEVVQSVVTEAGERALSAAPSEQLPGFLEEDSGHPIIQPPSEEPLVEPPDGLEGGVEGGAASASGDAAGDGIVTASQLMQSAEAYERLGQVKEAETAYQQAQELLPDHPGALLGLARVHLRAGRLESADSQLRRALMLGTAGGDGTGAAALELLLELLRYRAAYGDMGDVVEALLWLEPRLSPLPELAAATEAAAIELLGETAGGHLEDLASLPAGSRWEVVQSLKRAETLLAEHKVRSAADEIYGLLTLHPGFLPGQLILAQLLLAQGRVGDATERAQRVASLYEMRGARRQARTAMDWMAQAGLASGEEGAGLVQLSMSGEGIPGNGPSGTALDGPPQGQPEHGAAYWEVVLEQAETHLSSGQPQVAAELLRTALQVDGAMEEATRAALLRLLGTLEPRTDERLLLEGLLKGMGLPDDLAR